VLTRWLAWTRGIARRRRIDTEIDEELAFHLHAETEANLTRGLAPEAARRAALLSLGGVAQTTESVRAVRTLAPDAVWRDLRHALRSLRAAPGFTLVALLVLTLSIGAAATIFSIVDAVVLRPLPFPDADRLVSVGERNTTRSAPEPHLAAPQNFLDWRTQQRSFTALAAIGYASISVRPERDQEPETLEAQAVTAAFFDVLGVAPLVGRPFTIDHEVDGRARVAVISYGLWQRRFGGRPDIVGRVLPGQLASFEILAVMPPGFAWPVGATRPTEVWIPSVFRPDERVRQNSYGYRLEVIGRLREGVSIDLAQGDMDRITTGLAAQTPHWFANRVAIVEPLREHVAGEVRRWMLMLLAAVGFVLLIATVNLANLVLVRVSARSRELVVRSALGASRWDLVRTLIAESLVLSLAGAAFGSLLAWGSIEVLRAAMPADVPRAASIGIDLRVLAATIAAAIASGLAFSAAPVLLFSRHPGSIDVAGAGRAHTSTHSHNWLRGALVTMEVALATVLLVGAGLFLASFARVTRVDIGFDPQHVLTVRVRPLVGAANWALAQQRHRGLLTMVLERVRAVPGVAVAAWVGGGVPLRGDFRTTEIGVPGRVLPPDEDLDFNQISPDYFRVLGAPLLAGRFFTDADRDGTEPVVIINEAAARRYFPDENPMGRTIEFLGARRIVGIIGSIRHEGPEAAWRRQGFVPLEQSDAVGATLVLRLSRDARDVLPAVKAAIWSEFPGLALPDISTLSEYLDGLVAERRFNMLLLAVFGILGIVIACVGIYGVLAYVVLLRTPEIGVRMALGAAPAHIRRSVLQRAAMHLVIGLAIGLAGSWMLSTLVAGFLFEVRPHDPWIYAAVSGTLVASGLAAALIPARRAARVDPLIALRAP
jgi:putative ABC transport system permease protein